MASSGFNNISGQSENRISGNGVRGMMSMSTDKNNDDEKNRNRSRYLSTNSRNYFNDLRDRPLYRGQIGHTSFETTLRGGNFNARYNPTCSSEKRALKELKQLGKLQAEKFANLVKK